MPASGSPGHINLSSSIRAVSSSEDIFVDRNLTPASGGKVGLNGIERQRATGISRVPWEALAEPSKKTNPTSKVSDRKYYHDYFVE
jgi:hypothetical protein